MAANNKPKASTSQDGMSAVGRRQRMLSFENHRSHQIAKEFMAEQQAANAANGLHTAYDENDPCIEHFLAGGKYLAAKRAEEARAKERIKNYVALAIVGVMVIGAVAITYFVHFKH